MLRPLFSILTAIGVLLPAPDVPAQESPSKKAPAQDDLPPAVRAARAWPRMLDAATRVDAMMALWQCGPDAVPVLLRGLRHKDLVVVQASCGVLRELGGWAKSAEKHLVRRMGEAKGERRRAFEWALQGIASERLAVAEWDKGQVTFLGFDGESQGMIGGLAHAWGVQQLPAGRVLVCKVSDHKVVEVDAAGKVLWEFGVRSPYRAHRLWDGTTMVTSHDKKKVVIVDDAGKVVRQVKDVQPSAAQVLLNGHLLIARSDTNEITEFDRDGKEVRKTKLAEESYGFRRLWNGTTAIALRDSSRVDFLDPQDAKVRSIASLPSPNGLILLPDGRCFVACSDGVRAVDAKGKILWHHKGQWMGGISR